ncbi:MAG TPA: TIGR03000 domain-containing protein [Gemmataceae bacterium]|nr:TIGR03000 domain-containing protein [Gemmataceae bacterium]
MNWTRLGSLALAAAAFLTWPAESQAQIRGWGWRGRPGVYADYGYPYGWSWGYGRGYSPYYYSPWYTWYPSSAYTYTYGNAPSSYSYRAAYPPDSSFGAMPARNDTVLTEVRLPVADARLWMEGQEMNPQGLVRLFISPPLDPGNKYSYTLRAQWTENGKNVDQTRQANVSPGERITVDFTAPEGSGPSGTRRQSNYGPGQGGTTPKKTDSATPPRPKPSTPPPPPDRPRDNGENRDGTPPPN